MLVFRALCSGATFSQWISARMVTWRIVWWRWGKGHFIPDEGEAFKVLFTTCFYSNPMPTNSYYLYKVPKGECGRSLTRYLPPDLTACLCSNRRLYIHTIKQFLVGFPWIDGRKGWKKRWKEKTYTYPILLVWLEVSSPPLFKPAE